mgnify:CR=1 FL=1
MGIRRWIQDRPHGLERLWQALEWTLQKSEPLVSRVGYDRTATVILPFEDIGKKLVFNCQTCGQCVLHYTGMTCPMNCPKNLRNGPCGGVRENGHCEVIPERRCVWVQAWERAQQMPKYGDELCWVMPPVDRTLQGTSAWANMMEGRDFDYPPGWIAVAELEGEATAVKQT